MMRNEVLISRLASRIDIPLLLGVLALCVVGLVVIYSAGGENLSLLIRQGVRVAVAIAVMAMIAATPTSVLRKFSPILYLVGLALLVLVLMAGSGSGARRWLELGVVRFQPSELMKLVVPMMVAWILTSNGAAHRRLPFAIGALVLVPPVLFVFQQPDLGTALLIAASGAVAIFLGGLGWRWIAGSMCCALIAAPTIWQFLHDYQRRRVLVMFDPYMDPSGAGYQTIQSQIAIGSGGVYGKGWLNGSQSQLEFIPERHTDFIFSVFAEEFGLIGSLAVLLIYSILVGRCMLIAYRAKYDYGRIVAGSVGVMLFFHFFVNIGMVSGILPVVGIPLPLISYGGTSMVSLLGGIGIVMGAKYAER